MENLMRSMALFIWVSIIPSLLGAHEIDLWFPPDVNHSDQTLFYQNHVFREEYRALQDVLDQVSPPVTLIAYYHQLPVSYIQVDSTGAFRSIGWDFPGSLPAAPPFSTPPQLILHPVLKDILGNYDDAVKLQINLMPELRLTFWQGHQISVAPIFRLYNELKEEGYLADTGQWKLGYLTLNQTWRLPRNLFISATIGQFFEDRYGVDLEFKRYFANSPWAVGGYAGYTAYSSYTDATWRYTNLFELGVVTGQLYVEYRVAPVNTTLHAGYHQFLYGDRGVQVEIRRQFRRIDLDLTGLWSRYSQNAGFRVRIPLPPARSTVPIRPADHVVYEYRMRSYLYGGIEYNPGTRLRHWQREFYPDYLRRAVSP